MTNYIERYWRDAKPEDAIKEPPMVARFRMYGDVPWTMGELHGTHTRGGRIWFDKRFCNSWTICQVYDAPDPGEGWRLIDTANEEPQDGDEIYDPCTKQWTKRMSPFRPNVVSVNRRRITPTITYIPFTWEDREQLRGRWIKFKDGREVQCTKLEPLNTSSGMAINCYTPLELLQSATFLDTGKPVGKEVTQ